LHFTIRCARDQAYSISLLLPSDSPITRASS